MDIKYKDGLPHHIFEQALAQAKKARLHILNEMQKVMTVPNAKLSALVPQFMTLKVAKEKIGAIIGKGGQTIRDITEKTGTTIDIQDDGLVKIFGHPGEKLEQALSWVKVLGGIIEPHTKYTGVVKRFADFGIFVELAPGVDGLVHVSTISNQDKEAMKNLQINDVVTVEVLDYEVETGRIRLKIIG